VLLNRLLNGPTLFGRANQFPLAMSFSTALSNVKSATIFFSLAFSDSRSFSFLAWLTFNPPYSFDD